jgi:hypothetical protein
MVMNDRVELIFHVNSCYKFQVAKTQAVEGGREVETSNRSCPGYFLQAGIPFPEPPSHKIPEFGHKKTAKLPGCGLARLLEVSSSSHKVMRCTDPGQVESEKGK